MGIYKITNPLGKVYIGQTVDYDRRVKSYKKFRCKSQIKLYNSLLKYGVESHLFEFIEECDESKLNQRERYWQDVYDVLNEGLNLKLTNTKDRSGKFSEEIVSKMRGNRESISGMKNPFYGKNHSDETRKLISEKSKGHLVSDLTRKKISNTTIGVSNSKIHNENISNGLKGHSVSENTRNKQSESMKRYYENNSHPMQGKTQSEETRKKISESQRLRLQKKSQCKTKK